MVINNYATIQDFYLSVSLKIKAYYNKMLCNRIYVWGLFN